MTKAQIAALYGKPGTGRNVGVASKRFKRSRVVTLIRETTDDGNTVLTKAHVKKSELGQFVGNVGSITRSRKGATRRKCNGWRKYDGYTNVEVVAYLARP